ncbi:MAG TPA: D-alanyl-D-alanine carboxypeptidase/D-alanyl-D-alanine-endopeptidase [Acidiferrobacteraceae bacterium]|nr:D-alanyl-D-alanine carboxypeptidase/D-alanyl-D-alanine-endopeptidase [Acidiferrobacteraceae bacterium]
MIGDFGNCSMRCSTPSANGVVGVLAVQVMRCRSIISGHRLLVGLVLTLLGALPAVADSTLPKSLVHVLDQYGIPKKAVSIFVQAVDASDPVLTHLPHRPRNPASVMKLLTSFVALDTLGPAYQWSTEAWSTVDIVDGELDGDLYIKGYGDPYLLNEYFWRFLHDLRQAGLQHIHGDLVIDNDYLAPEVEDPAEFDGRPHRAYNATPAALLLNYQAIRFRLIPRPSDSRLHIVADPMPHGLDLKNSVRLVEGVCHRWGRRLSMRISRVGDRDQVSFSGRYPRQCGENALYRVVSGADDYIYGVFKSLWTGQGGQIDGQLRHGQVPEQAQRIGLYQSRPLAEVLRGMNKYSNNVMARQLFLTLGAQKLEPPGTRFKAQQVVQQWLKDHGLKAKGTVIDNGAGLSRRSRLTASQLGRLLVLAYAHPYMPEYMSSLSVAAVDGTLRKRFGKSRLGGRMHIKTGLLDDVRSMAGYILSRSGKRYAVVILHNHYTAQRYAGERLQDALLNWVYER